MKIISYVRDGMGLRPVEVEISLSAGLPKIQYLGLPDTLIKESVLRIQSALKHQGFKLPKAKQILVNLKPSYLKKTSQGLDLAVAAGILWETGQIPIPDKETVALYGELTLKGEVKIPDDFEDLIEAPQAQLFFTGPIQSAHFDLLSIMNLKNLEKPELIRAGESFAELKRPQLPKILITSKMAELLKLIAVGEHHALIAGPPGTGKTTLAASIPALMSAPNIEQFKKSQQISRQFGIPLQWRPVVSPHHTSTGLAMIGGGNHPTPGEITRAHGGVLILDELLEFESRVLEVLREPIESGKITISRMGSVMIFPARFTLIGTTNLCNCGHLIPDKNFECKGRPKFCLNYVQKLSGPLLDRFTMLSFSNNWNDEGEISFTSLFKEIEEIQKFSNYADPCAANQFMDIEKIEETLGGFEKKYMIPETGNSKRRYNSLLRLARTFADIDFSEKIKSEHLEKARIYTIDNFEILRNMSQGF